MQWNTGRSYKLDRARHNKSEEYEVPVNKRKRRFKSGGTLVDDKKAMVLSQIKEVHHHADELAKVLANMDTVDAWVVGKMERATTDLSDITHYLDGTTEYAKGGMMSDEMMSQKKVLFYRNKLVQMNVGKDSSALDFAIRIIDSMVDKDDEDYVFLTSLQNNKKALFYRNKLVQMNVGKNSSALDFAIKLIDMAYDGELKMAKGGKDYADGGMMANGGINNEYFSKQASMKGGIDYYSVDIDTEDGDEIRDLEFKSYSAAKKAYDKYKKSMKYNGETIEDIQLICNYKNGDYDSIGYVGKYNEMTEGQSILLKSIPNPIYERFYNKEVVIEELNGNKITKAFVRNTGEKVPFVIDLNTFKVEKYASGGMMKYNLSFNYNPSNLKNSYAEKIVSKYTKDWKHDNDQDEVSFFVMGLTMDKAKELESELKMEDAYNFEITKSRYASGGMMAKGGEVKSKIKKYQILSPDGITIEREVPYYTSKNKAMSAFDKWKENYSRQGYYSSVRYGRIDLLDLEDYCQFITL